MAPKIVSGTAQSTINTNRDKNLNALHNVQNDISLVGMDEAYYSGKVAICDSLIAKLDETINSKTFMPIAKLQARWMRRSEIRDRNKYQKGLDRTRAKMAKLQFEELKLVKKDEKTAHANDNTGFMQRRNVGGAYVKIRDGKVDFSKDGKVLTENLFDPQTGEPTANFDRLKQVLVDYPKSITSLPDSVVKELNSKQVTARSVQGTFDLNGKTYNMAHDKQVSGFDYMKGMAAAGFEIAKQQGREIQSNPEAEVEFTNWVQEKEDMLKGKTKTTTTQQQQANNNTYEAQF